MQSQMLSPCRSFPCSCIQQALDEAPIGNQLVSSVVLLVTATVIKSVRNSASAVVKSVCGKVAAIVGVDGNVDAGDRGEPNGGEWITILLDSVVSCNDVSLVTGRVIGSVRKSVFSLIKVVCSTDVDKEGFESNFDGDEAGACVDGD